VESLRPPHLHTWADAVEGTLWLYEAALPHYAAHPDRLALMLYDHAHTGTERQMQDAITWMAPFFLRAEEAA
jgi:hypothetical protein